MAHKNVFEAHGYMIFPIAVRPVGLAEYVAFAHFRKVDSVGVKIATVNYHRAFEKESDAVEYAKTCAQAEAAAAPTKDLPF